jgi:hypothetical protein
MGWDSSQIAGPALIGLVYMWTVATLPQMLFLVIVGMLVLSLLVLMLVRLTPEVPVVNVGGDGEECGLGASAETLVEVYEREEGLLVLVDEADEAER